MSAGRRGAAAAPGVEPGAEPGFVPVRSGGLTAFVAPGELRSVRLGDTELVRRAHVAVRDPGWATIPLGEPRVDVRRTTAGLVVEQRGRCRTERMDVTLTIQVAAPAGGPLELAVDTLAIADTDYNRIGICVLLPSETAGLPYEATTAGGAIRGRLPREIAPQEIDPSGQIHAMFAPFSALAVGTADAGVRLSFEGDEFEIEDQRNWADASFKIYSTPLALGFPHRLAAGAALRQRVVIERS